MCSPPGTLPPGPGLAGRAAWLLRRVRRADRARRPGLAAELSAVSSAVSSAGSRGQGRRPGAPGPRRDRRPGLLSLFFGVCFSYVPCPGRPEPRPDGNGDGRSRRMGLTTSLHVRPQTAVSVGHSGGTAGVEEPACGESTSGRGHPARAYSRHDRPGTAATTGAEPPGKNSPTASGGTSARPPSPPRWHAVVSCAASPEWLWARHLAPRSAPGPRRRRKCRSHCARNCAPSELPRPGLRPVLGTTPARCGSFG